MKYTRLDLYNKAATPFSISNEFQDIAQVEDAIEDGKNAADIADRLLNQTDNFLKIIEVDRETDEYIRLRLTANMCNNIYYLKIWKAK